MGFSGGGAGGGGTQPITRATRTLTSAEILALNTVPIEITSAPAAGHMFIPIQVLFAYKFVTTPYTDATNQVLYISTIQEYTIESNGGSWGRTAKGATLKFPFSTSTILTPDDDVSFAGANGHALAVFANNPFTLGDGTLTITVWYADELIPA